MIWLAWACQLVTLAVGIWIGWERGYAAGQQDALLRAQARLAREHFERERDRVEPEEGEDEDF